MKNQDIQKKIHMAYLSLANTEEIAPINVRRLTETAGIARSTFYTHYDNIDQMIVDMENNFLEQLKTIYLKYLRVPLASEKTKALLIEWLAFLRTNQLTFSILCEGKGKNSFITKLANTIKLLLMKKLHTLNLEYSDVQITFATTGLLSLTEFLDSDKTDPEIAEEYAALLIQIFQ